MSSKSDLPLSTLKQDLQRKSRTRRAGLERHARAVGAKPISRNDLLPTLVVVEVALSDLKMPSRRLRKAEAAHVQNTANAIAALGFCQPILLGNENAIVDGAIRADAAKLLGMTKVPCIRVAHLTADEQRLLRLAANRLGERGTWDVDELKIEFEELIDMDLSLEITGFEAPEIDLIVLGDANTAVEKGALEPRPDAVAIARLGDMVRLGPHRLICGDARDPAVLERLMSGAPSARLVLTDVPYNVAIRGNVTGGDHREFQMASGELTLEEFAKFNVDWIAAALPHLVDGGLLGSFIDWRGLATLHAAAQSHGLDQLNLIAWAKSNAGMGSLWRSQHELLPVYKKGDAPHVNNVQLGKHGNWRSNVWRYAGASSLGSDARKGLQDHPTVKPSAMLRDALLDVTHRGDIVLDPFAGSGSMFIAAEEVGRVCYGIELDPLYCDVIIRRLCEVTGIEATLAEIGRPISETSHNSL